MSDFFKDLLFNAGIGLLAGSVATIISHPFDTIKIHIQIKKKILILNQGLLFRILNGFIVVLHHVL